MPAFASPALGATWRADLIDLLERQETVCRELLQRCESQTDLISERRNEELLGLLNERQLLIDELGELAHSLEPFRQSWSQIWQALDENERQLVQERVGAVERIIGRVMTQDSEDQKRIENERDRVRSELDTVATGRTTTRAYGRDANRGVSRVTNRFTDERG